MDKAVHDRIKADAEAEGLTIKDWIYDHFVAYFGEVDALLAAAETETKMAANTPTTRRAARGSAATAYTGGKQRSVRRS
jgi:hypothetical protein